MPPPDSIDTFIAWYLPTWLRQADAALLEAFAAPLLETALEAAGAGRLQPPRCVYPSTMSRLAAALHNASETRARVVASLAQRPFWERYVRERYPQRFERLAEPFHQRLEALEAAVGGTGEQHYLQQSNRLKTELEGVERELMQTVANGACDRSGT